MTRILITQTASARRVRAAAEAILKGNRYQAPSVTLLCKSEPDTIEYLGQIPDAEIVPLRSHQTLEEMRRRDFDLVVTFWTGEKGYWREKVAAARLCRNTIVDMGDGGQWRLTWRFMVRYWLFRLRHPLPSDHALYALPPGAADPPSRHDGERILIIQSAEPPHVLRALENFERAPIFRRPRFTLFCRNRPEILARFENHPMLQAVRTHSETGQAWRHLRHLRREHFDAVVVFFTGDPSYWKIKFLPFLLGARHKLIVNESGDCFFFSWRRWLSLMAQRMGEQYRMRPEARWTQQSRFLSLCLLKLVVFPFRFAWLLIVWVWLRSTGAARPGRNPGKP